MIGDQLTILYESSWKEEFYRSIDYAEDIGRHASYALVFFVKFMPNKFEAEDRKR
jgi:hypothetical protein